MSNISHIAMLAQIRSNLFDEVTRVSDVACALRDADDFRQHDASTVESRLHDDAAALSFLILAQRPTDMGDVLSLAHCIGDMTDEIKSLAEGDATGLSRINEIADRLDLAANNIVAFLADTVEPRTDSERRRTAVVVGAVTLTPLAAGEA